MNRDECYSGAVGRMFARSDSASYEGDAGCCGQTRRARSVYAERAEQAEPDRRTSRHYGDDAVNLTSAEASAIRSSPVRAEQRKH